MRKTICAAVLVGGAAIFAATSFTPAPAQAATGVVFDFGNIAFAYTDGYYDHHHRWHRWRHGEWDRYRRHHRGHYYNWRHDDHRHHHHYRYRDRHHH
jgi:hypothetical protein